VISQIQENRERIVSYYSAVHNKAQRNYSPTHKKLLAAVSAIEHFRPYLAGKPCAEDRPPGIAKPIQDKKHKGKTDEMVIATTGIRLHDRISEGTGKLF
jgi:hypothetical protein